MKEFFAAYHLPLANDEILQDQEYHFVKLSIPRKQLYILLVCTTTCLESS